MRTPDRIVLYNITELLINLRYLNIQANRRLRDSSDPFSLPEENFRNLYRLSKDVARYTFLQIQDDLNIPMPSRITKIPAIVEFVAVLHFLAFGNYQRSTGKDTHCSMSQPAVSRAIHRVIPAILNRLHHHIRYPQNLQETVAVKNGFFEKFGIPGITGIIDCTHIAIVPPAAGNLNLPRLVFLNRKNFFSINCQIICDSNLKILSMNARYPGSVHDAAIWTMSDVGLEVRRRYQNGERNSWLLGDSAYPLLPYLLTPIIGADPEEAEGRYTAFHCRARNTVERCFGVLKGRFRCLHPDRVLHYSPVFVPQIIYACAILHNIMRDANIDDIEGIDIAADNDHVNGGEGGREVNEEANLHQLGVAARNALINRFF